MIYLKRDDELLGNYEFLYAKISANLIHYFGDSSLQNHTRIVNDYLKYKQQCERHLSNANKFSYNYVFDNTIISNIVNAPIIYSFCIGEYRLLPIFLLECGFNISILIKGRILNKYSAFFDTLKKNLKINNSTQTNVDFISSDDRNVLLKLRNAISDGKKILVFIDGNAGSVDNKKNVIKTSFFAQPILFHQGVAFLSYIFKVKPIGIVLLFKNDKIQIELLPNNSILNSDKNTFINSVISEQLSYLSTLITQYGTAVWDAVESIHSWIDINNINLNNFEIGENLFLDRNNTKCNIFRYAPFHFHNEYYLLDKKRYLTHKVTKHLYEQYSKIARIYF